MAAIRAAQLGMKTAVVEKDKVGGRCLNYACIPAKAVLRVADILSEIDEADEFGIAVAEPHASTSARSCERREKVIKTLTGGVAGLFKKNKIDVHRGRRLAHRRRQRQGRRRLRRHRDRGQGDRSSPPARCPSRSPARSSAAA